MASVSTSRVPKEIFAILSTFLGQGESGDFCRTLAGNMEIKTVDKDSCTYKNGLLHSYGGNPAVTRIMSTGIYEHIPDTITREWWTNGVRTHYVIICASGTEHWYDGEGLSHREGDLPADVYADGDRVWYKHGRLHRDGDFPAIIIPDIKVWYKDGKIDREGKPAVIHTSGEVEYWRDDVRYYP